MVHRQQTHDFWIFEINVDAHSSDRCTLITDTFAKLLQVLLAFVAVLILYIKRKLESPVRPFHVWVFDVGKQCLGAFYVHCLSIVLSIVMVAGMDSTDDECAIYFVTYMLDSTLGLALVIMSLQAMQHVVVKLEWNDVIDCGFYGDPPQWRIWLKQFGVYLIVLTFMKLTNFVVLYALFAPLANWSTDMFQAFENHRHLELLMVMIILPGCCNAFQFWIVDSYLKSDQPHWNYFKNFTKNECNSIKLPAEHCTITTSYTAVPSSSSSSPHNTTRSDSTTTIESSTSSSSSRLYPSVQPL